MNVVIDTGNTHCRVHAMENGRIVRSEVLSAPDPDALAAFVRDVSPARAIVSSTRGDAGQTASVLSPLVDGVTVMTPFTPVPIGVDYASMQTLGTDRIAVAVGVATHYALNDALIVDVGTAITVDLLQDGIFRGGNISPGLEMRARALAEYTACLPRVSVDGICCGDEIRLGDSTVDALTLGIVEGVALEIEGYAASVCRRLPEARVVLCGGGAECLGNRIKNAIFATCDIAAFGLNAILEYNER